MKLLCIVVMTCALLAAQDKTTTKTPEPKALTTEQKLSAAQDQVAVEANEIETLQASLDALRAAAKAQQADDAAVKSRAKYQESLKKLQGDAVVDGCQLNGKQEWVCQQQK